MKDRQFFAELNFFLKLLVSQKSLNLVCLTINVTPGCDDSSSVSNKDFYGISEVTDKDQRRRGIKHS
jgi:hypothetical protein